MRKIGITLGEQAGIGPEVVHKALASQTWPDDVEFVIIGEPLEVTPGIPTRQSALAALEALELGAKALNSGEIDAIVTAPVCKQTLHDVGFHYPGQTEFFADRLQCDNHAMCLTGENLTVALVTIHVALADVPDLLSCQEIVRVGKLLGAFCQQRGIKNPRVAVCGLNPHAGENGAFGQEEIHSIIPAINQLNAETDSSAFSGPHPPDTVFRPASHGDYDAVLCMYHDQGLIPLKLLDFDTGVNTTLGLAKPRTSPDHGSAFGIAGKGIADASSMQHAIKLACELA